MATRLRVAQALAAALSLAAAGGCTLTDPRLDEPGVFRDNWIQDGFQPFDPKGGADPTAVIVDRTVTRYRTNESPAAAGTATLKITVPTIGQYAGGAVVASLPRDLSGYNALTFWAKADISDAQFDVLGLANDNSGNSKFTTSVSALAIGTDWAKYAMPIPLPAKLTWEAGLLFFSAAAQDGAGFHIWLDDIKFESLNASQLGAPVPHIAPLTGSLTVGAAPVSVNVVETRHYAADGVTYLYSTYSDTADFKVTLPGNSSTVTVTYPPAYLTFTSSNPAVAFVDASGLVTAFGCGITYDPANGCTTAAPITIGAQLGPAGAAQVFAAPEQAVLGVTAPPLLTLKPTSPPTRAATDVVSLLTRVYTNAVHLAGGGLTNSWGTDWSNGGFPAGGPHLTELQIDGDNVKKYDLLSYVGIDFSSQLLDVTAMNTMHLDIWTPNATLFKVQLVDLAPNSTKIAIVTVNPAPAKKSWVALDIPLSKFAAAGSDTKCGDPNNTANTSCLTTRAHLGQIVLISDGNASVYVDNLYFYK